MRTFSPRKALPLLLPALSFAIIAAGCQTAKEERSGAAVDKDERQEAEVSPETDRSPCPASAEEPPGILLTWKESPATTMIIDWHSEPGHEALDILCLRAAGEKHWSETFSASSFDFPFGDRRIHRVELQGLQPESLYEFQVGEFGRTYSFRTMPESIDERPLTFATGGDTQHLPRMFAKTNQAAMQYDLDFIAWGGDLAYADGGTASMHIQRWNWWFETLRDTLIAPDGRVIPILLAAGNHEVAGGYIFAHENYRPTDAWRLRIAPYFYTLFAFPGQPGYAALDFGDYLSLLFLDTDHTNPIDGPQKEWLQETLHRREQEGIPHIFPIYHVPAFPSHRDFDGPISSRVRQHWVPLFEAYGVEVAFENHDHAYKRTHPIREGAVDPDEGILYIGDGAWGVMTRSGSSRNQWYIDQFHSRRHAIIVTLLDSRRHILVIDDEGEVLDEVGAPLR